MHLGVFNIFNAKTSITFILQEQEGTYGLLGYPYSYIYTQQTGMLKAMATTDTFFTISRVMLSIDN